MKFSIVAALLATLAHIAIAAPVNPLMTQDASEPVPLPVPIAPIIKRFAVCLQFENAVACEESCACKPVGGFAFGRRETDSKMVCKDEAASLGCASNCECGYEIENAAEIEEQKKLLKCAEGEGDDCALSTPDQDKVGELPHILTV